MQIAIITQEFPPTKAGGIATWAYYLAKEFSKMGHNVTVFTKKRGGCDDPSVHEDEAFKLKLMPGRNWHKHYELWTYLSLRPYLKKNRDALVITATWELSTAILRLKKFDPYLITAAHGLEITRIKTKKLEESKNKLLKVIRGSDKIVSVSRYTKEFISELCGFEPENSIVINNGVDFDDFYLLPDRLSDSIRAHYNILPDKKILLTLARMIPRKGHDIVIKAISEIRSKDDIVYLIAGVEDKKWRRSLDRLIEENNLESNVRFLGFVKDNEKLNLYNIADIYVMVSKRSVITGDSEGFGITFLEANACGTPVIGSNEGGIPDAIEDGVSGVIVEADNVEETAKAIEDILSDDNYRQELSENGRNRIIDSFTWAKIANKFIQLKK